jgi:hypothetical protein
LRWNSALETPKAAVAPDNSSSHRPGQHLREVQNLHALERSRHVISSPRAASEGFTSPTERGRIASPVAVRLRGYGLS